MKIIYRNFTKLLSAGAFGEECVLEPMSKFKWSKLLSVANVYGVSDFVNTGIAQIGSAIIPDGIYEQAKSNVYRSENTQNEKNVNQAYNVGKQKKFSNPYLNNRYSKLVFNEIHNIDTSINSLVLLDKLISNINTLLDYGVTIREMVFAPGLMIPEYRLPADVTLKAVSSHSFSLVILAVRVYSFVLPAASYAVI